MTFEATHKTRLLEHFRTYLSTQDKVIFAYVFGSFAQREQFRDIDIGVYLAEPFHLEDLAGLQSDLQQLTDAFILQSACIPDYTVDPMDPFSGLPVDLVVMNTLPETNPELSQDIVNDSICIKCASDYSIQVAYIVKSLHYFEDTRYLRALSQQALMRRLKEKRFGDRNYESEPT